MAKKWTGCLSMGLIVSLAVSSGVLADNETPNDEVPEENSEDSRIIYQDDTAVSAQMQRSVEDQESNADSAKRFLEANNDFFDMTDPIQDMEVLEEQTDDEGMTHIRLQQTKNGIPVEGHEVIVHFDEDTTIDSVNGHFDSQVDEMDTISSSAVFPEDEAIENAREAVNAPEDLEEDPETELVYYPVGDDTHLVYKANITFMTEEPGNWFVFVDASTGEVIDQYNTISHMAEAAGLEDEALQNEENKQADASFSDAEPDAEEYQSATGPGIGVQGENRVLNISHKAADNGPGRTFSLFDFSIPDLDGILTYDAQEDFVLPGVPYSNEDAAFDFRDEFHAAAVDAHYNSTEVYEYFWEEHDRNSLDDEGMSVVSSVHYGEDFANAFWNGSQMTYGDGDDEMFIPLSAGLDVAAHEMTHGVTEHTAGLVYRFQSGAVNEAMSDIFGVLVDESSWHIGEDVMAPAAIEDGRFALRSLEDPGQFDVDEAYWAYGDGSGAYPSHMDEYYDLPIDLDNGGVHINSSIINHAAYLIGQDIGREDLGQIAYRALTTYLTPMSDFDDTRFAFVQSSIDIYGEDSDQTEAVRDGFDGVGIE
ncbi:peptidase M4 family protein [Salicibibacter cibarius]|uniref:Neutral metalloproteinase n=1 Tax=Salicibibacter cibarius TaxID=2743000 RepID=A0A7T6Z0N6_9BACI|nr:M4 family metallopeptidase [Salicibibacter cibarius]QQK74785.1 peptidase M4 family protein [Salicibibacter cibarius]